MRREHVIVLHERLAQPVLGQSVGAIDFREKATLVAVLK